MAKYIYGNTITAHTVAKSNDVITEFQAIQAMSAIEDVRTDDSIKFPAGEGNDIRIVENAAQRISKVITFDTSGDIILVSASAIDLITDASQLLLLDVAGNYNADNVEDALIELASTHTGKVSTAGTFTAGKNVAGWSSGQSATGVFFVTHNLGHTNYTVMAICFAGSTPHNASINNKSASNFFINTSTEAGTLTYKDFEFILIED